MTTRFDVLAAIDLQDGQAVRLRQGDPARPTAFSDDPVAVAAGFVEAGARWLHVVDLDGAMAGEPVHVEVIKAIVELVHTSANVEVAGGLRADVAVATVLRAGAARAVVGTAALRDPAFAARLVERYGSDRIAVAIDVRDGLAIGEGWRPGAPGVPPEAALTALADAGVTTFEATAIDRDGMLGGPDVDLLGRLVDIGRGAVVASGGVASLDDLRAIRALGCRGAIVGRALYEGRVRLEDALATAGGTEVGRRPPA